MESVVISSCGGVLLVLSEEALSIVLFATPSMIGLSVLLMYKHPPMLRIRTKPAAKISYSIPNAIVTVIGINDDVAIHETLTLTNISANVRKK